MQLSAKIIILAVAIASGISTVGAIPLPDGGAVSNVATPGGSVSGSVNPPPQVNPAGGSLGALPPQGPRSGSLNRTPGSRRIRDPNSQTRRRPRMNPYGSARQRRVMGDLHQLGQDRTQDNQISQKRLQEQQQLQMMQDQLAVTNAQGNLDQLKTKDDQGSLNAAMQQQY